MSSTWPVGAALDLHLDQQPQAHRLGQGRRLVTVAYTGRKWVDVLDPCTLRHARFHQRQLRQLAPRPAEVDPGRLMRLLRGAWRTHTRLGLPLPPKRLALAVVEALGGTRL